MRVIKLNIKVKIDKNNKITKKIKIVNNNNNRKEKFEN